MVLGSSPSNLTWDNPLPPLELTTILGRWRRRPGVGTVSRLWRNSLLDRRDAIAGAQLPSPATQTAPNAANKLR